MKTVFVVNPASANGRTGKEWPGLSAKLTSLGIEHEAALTRAPAEATKLTATALRNGADVVVAVGGDGTLNEVANGFFLNGDPPPGSAIALMPYGTGGDFRRTFGIPTELEKVAEMLKSNSQRKIDAGRINMQSLDDIPLTRHFVNIADAGIGGVVVDRVNHASKILGGKATFNLVSLRTLLTFKPPVVEVRTDERNWEGKAQNVVIANGEYFGGSMHVAPGAKPDDGKFDIVVFGDIGGFEAIRQINDIYKASHVKNPKVQTWRAAEVEVLSGERVLIDVDGEMCGTLPAKFKVLPQALKLVVP
ncbi:MAG: diacylglycerol kinase family lipid kinase [Candidatus Dormibacteraeota bacterium]|nr:diacylglycerol kinase family lipid kinase [Candidatus Dormibacteraeota bacterium]